MSNNKLIKLMIITVASSLLLIYLLSPGFAGMRPFEGTFAGFLFKAAALLAVSAAIWFGLRSRKRPPAEVNAGENHIASLKALSRADVFAVNAKCLIEQIHRFEDKLDTVDRIILQKFQEGEISYLKFKQVMDATRTLFYSGVGSAVNRMIAFDEDDYLRITQGQVKMSQTLLETKMKLYREHLDFINTTVEKNEEVLLRLDRLLLESSKMSSLEVENLDNMQAIRELDALTDQAKLYK